MPVIKNCWIIVETAMPKICPANIDIDRYIITKASKKLALNWSLIIVFVLIFLVSGWMIITNSVQIYNVYVEWKANSKPVLEDLDWSGFLATGDDETYPANKDPDPVLPGNDTIRQNIRKMEKQYRQYNKELALSKRTDDIVNEKIMAPRYDNYKKTVLPTKIEDENITSTNADYKKMT
jgi:hypothetical protein